MDENNKPETTNPVETVVPEPTREELTTQRVIEAFAPKVEVAVPAPATEGTSNVGTQSEPSKNDEAVLNLLKATTGREFGSIDAYKQHITNLNSLVGDQAIAKTREAAKQYDTLVNAWATKNGKSVDEAKQLLADTIIGAPQQSQQETQKPQAIPQVPKEFDERLAKLEDAEQRLALNTKYPFAKEAEAEIALIAKAKGVSYVEAFETSPFKQLLEQKAKEDSKKSPVVTPGNRTGFDTKKVEELGMKVLANDSFDNKQKLVKEYLGM